MGNPPAGHLLRRRSNKERVSRVKDVFKSSGEPRGAKINTLIRTSLESNSGTEMITFHARRLEIPNIFDSQQ